MFFLSFILLLSIIGATDLSATVPFVTTVHIVPPETLTDISHEQQQQEQNVIGGGPEKEYLNVGTTVTNRIASHDIDPLNVNIHVAEEVINMTDIPHGDFHPIYHGPEKQHTKIPASRNTGTDNYSSIFLDRPQREANVHGADVTRTYRSLVPYPKKDDQDDESFVAYWLSQQHLLTKMATRTVNWKQKKMSQESSDDISGDDEDEEELLKLWSLSSLQWNDPHSPLPQDMARIHQHQQLARHLMQQHNGTYRLDPRLLSLLSTEPNHTTTSSTASESKIMIPFEPISTSRMMQTNVSCIKNFIELRRAMVRSSSSTLAQPGHRHTRHITLCDRIDIVTMRNGGIDVSNRSFHISCALPASSYCLIDLHHHSRLFFGTQTNLTFHNIIFQNGYHNHSGGLMLIQNQSSLSFTNCVFQNNHVNTTTMYFPLIPNNTHYNTDYSRIVTGGGVLHVSSSSHVSIMNCTFYYNSIHIVPIPPKEKLPPRTELIDRPYGGGAILMMDSTIRIHQSNFLYNTIGIKLFSQDPSYGGGALYIQNSNLSITGTMDNPTKFHNNDAHFVCMICTVLFITRSLL
jgi:hypothetical protein